MDSVSISALRPKVWERGLYADIVEDLFFNKRELMGSGDNVIIEVKEGLQKSPGDAINFGFVPKITGQGRDGDDELEGHEQQMLSYNDSVVIDQKRQAVRLTGNFDEKINGFDFRTRAKTALRDWYVEFFEQQIFLKLGGVTNTSLIDINGDLYAEGAAWSNTPDGISDADTNAGTGSRYLCANAGGADALTSADLLTPTLISRLKMKAKYGSPKMVPLRVDGMECFVMFIHPWQALDLKKNAEFAQAQREAQARGKDNPIFTGALMYWDGVIIHEHPYCPFLDVSESGNNFNAAGSGTDYAVDTARAILCGQRAIAFAKAEGDGRGWVEKTFDYGNQWGVSSSFIGGIQKVLFNSKEYGVCVLDTAVTNYA